MISFVDLLRLRYSVLCVSLLAGLAASPARGEAPLGPPEVEAGVLPDEFAVDGVLDEAAWQTVPANDRFTQSDPIEGAAPSARTSVRVLAGAKALVIGVECDDPEPDAIVSFSVARDASLRSEDHLRIVLGPVSRRALRLSVLGESQRGSL